MYSKPKMEAEALLPNNKVQAKNRLLTRIIISLLACALVFVVGFIPRAHDDAKGSIAVGSVKPLNPEMTIESKDPGHDAEVPVGPADELITEAGDLQTELYTITVALMQGAPPFTKRMGRKTPHPSKTVDGRFEQIAELVAQGRITPDVAKILTGSPEGRLDDATSYKAKGFKVAFHCFWGAEKENVGHTSMFIPSDDPTEEYASFWPQDSSRAGAIGETTSTTKDFRQDNLAEKKQPDMIVMNLVDNEQCALMLDQWKTDKTKPFALTQGSNCSSMIYEILKAANIDLKPALKLSAIQEAVFPVGKMMRQWRPSWVFKALITADLNPGSGWIRNPGRKCCELERMFLNVNVATLEISPELAQATKTKMNELMRTIPICGCSSDPNDPRLTGF